MALDDKHPKKKKGNISDLMKMILEAAGGDDADVKVHKIKGKGGHDDLLTHLHEHIDTMHEKVDVMHSAVLGLSTSVGMILETQKETRDSMNELFKLFMQYVDQTKKIKKPKTE